MCYDIVIAGGGITGLATALQLLGQRPDLHIVVLEKENGVAQHQSSHNSGVIHSGIYYRPGTLRARNCLEGYRLLLDFCREHDIPHEICGKIIVATRESERPILDGILKRGIENGLSDIRKISSAEAREIEPHVQCVEAIRVPQAGIVDYGTVARKYAECIRQQGAVVATHQKVCAVKDAGDHLVVETENPEHSEWPCRLFVNCGGLYSDKLAALTGEQSDYRILPFRGEYYALKPEREFLVRHLVYPVPNPNFPFLGVHFTRMIGGDIEAGPNAVLAFRREGYSRKDFHWGEFSETLRFPGFRKIARRYWRDGLAEMKRSYFKKAFVTALRHMIPDISADDLIPGRSGVRAMACDRAGNLSDDFLILSRPRIVNVINAPSPAATASLAIGRTIAGKVLEQF